MRTVTTTVGMPSTNCHIADASATPGTAAASVSKSFMLTIRPRLWTFPGAAVWKVADPYPFAVFGGSGRLGGHGSADSPQGVTVFVYSSVGLGFGNVPVLGLASVNRVRNGLPCASSPW